MNGKKRTYEEAKMIVNDSGHELLSTYKKYISNIEKLVIKDKDNYYYICDLHNLLIKQFPRKYSKYNPYTIQNLKLWLSINNIPLELISKDYIIGKRLIFKDDDSYFYSLTLDSVIQFDKSCSPNRFHISNYYTIQNIKLWCKLNNKLFELVSDKYTNAKDKLIWKCLKEDCGEEFENNWNNIFSGQGCGVCSGQQVTLKTCLATKNPELAKEWHPNLNDDLTPFLVPEFCGTGVWWKCSKCNHDWNAVISNRSFRGDGCPKCRESHSEKGTTKYLEDMNYSFTSQFRLEDCRDKRSLPFDFAVFTESDKKYIKILIELDGLQHSQPVRFGGISKEKAEKNFIELQKRDKIKNDYCIDKNIPLLRIPYWEFDSIEEILIDVLVNGNMNHKYFVK